MASSAQPLFAFFGTSDFVIPALKALEEQGLTPALVVTAPPRPQGRGMKRTPSPVATWAAERGIDVLEPEKLDDTFAAEMQNTDWDFFLIASYGKLLPKRILDIPRRNCLNIHPSLLPKFRGASPFLSAILADERETGVTLMLMGEKMDAGPILAQARIQIDEADWPPKGSVLSRLLFAEGGTLVAENVRSWLRGELEAMPQDEAQATYTKKFTKEDARLDTDVQRGLPLHTRGNFLKIRAFDENPRAYFIDKHGKRIIVTEAAWHNNELHLERVIPEGKREMAFEDYAKSV